MNTDFSKISKIYGENIVNDKGGFNSNFGLSKKRYQNKVSEFDKIHHQR